MSNQKVTDSSQDKKYFILVPQIVWAYSRSAYDFTLWNVIKMVAGESGECFLSTEDLATLSMMSMGKVSECRHHLLETGLIKGECKKDPGYPQPVWHLRIPDLWPENVTWRQNFDDLDKRIEYKITQKKSLHQVKPSPGEKGYAPGEKGYAPGETKKNRKEQKVEPGPLTLKLLEICRLNVDRLTTRQEKNLKEVLDILVNKIGVTIEQLTDFDKFWQASWRNGPPTLLQIPETWGEFEQQLSGNQSVYRNGRKVHIIK